MEYEMNEELLNAELENVDALVAFLADDSGEKFYLAEAEEVEMLEMLPLANSRYEEVVLKF